MRRARILAGFALLVAAGTAAAGWWMVPLLAAAWVRVVARDPAPLVTCGFGTAAGWGLVLLWGAAHGPIGTVAHRVGGVFGLPSWAFVGVTLVFGGLLAAAAALAVRPDPPPHQPN